MKDKLLLKSVSMFLTIAIVVGIFPVKAVKADTTVGKSDTISVKYQEQSSWGNFKQAQIDVTNISDEAIDEWTVALTFDKYVQVSSIWNATLCESDISSENVLYITNADYNGHIDSGSTVSFGLITESESGIPTVSVVENTDSLPSDEETELFSYAVFTSNDFNFSGWKSNVVGSFYTGNNFNYQGSEIYLYGSLDVVNTYNCNGWKTEIGEINENCDLIEMPDFDEGINSLRDELDEISSDKLTSADSIVANGFYYYDGDVTISGTKFEGDCVIVASGNITYDVDTLSGDGRVVIYSTNGNITINGSEITINGILYAPNGNVNINAYNTTFNGRIVAKDISYQGSILNVTASGSDLELLYKYPEVDITASREEVYQGEYAYFEVELEDEAETPYVVKYRLNDEEVEIDETLTYVIDTTLIGYYTLEAYIEISNGEKVLDEETIVVKAVVTTVPTATNTPVPTATNIPVPTATNTPVPTATNTPVPTATNTPVPTATNTPVPTATNTPVPTATNTPVPTATSIPTPTEIPLNDQERYFVFSEGETDYFRYRTNYVPTNWKLSGRYEISSEYIALSRASMVSSATATYRGTREFSPDYSLDGRFTYYINSGDPGGYGKFYIHTPNIKNYTEGSIGVTIDPRNGNVGFTVNNIEVTTVYYEPIKEVMGKPFDFIYEYEGETQTFNLYIAEYMCSGNPVYSDTPVLSYNIDLAEVFGENREFTWSILGSNGWFCSDHLFYGVEVDPYPAIHVNDEPVTNPGYIPAEAEGFVSISQGDSKYGYETPFIENNWNYMGEAKCISDAEISLTSNETSVSNSGSAFLSFANNVAPDYSFYTRFSFTQKKDISNGLAFVIQPYDASKEFLGNSGYIKHDNSVIVEFDFNPQSNYTMRDENGEFVTYTESNFHVGIILNGNEEQHYAVVDYKDMRTTDVVTDAWVEYDGVEKVLSVYVCTMNQFGHVYQSDEPILSYSIDLDEYFDGNTSLVMGFVARDITNESNVVLNGFEISDKPYTTLGPTDYPLEEQDRYQIISMGDSTYGYERRYNEKEWLTIQDSAEIKSNSILLNSLFGQDEIHYKDEIHEFSPDYSFSGRTTFSINHDINFDNCADLTFYNPNVGEKEASFTIHIDICPSSNHYWKDEFGQGEWQEGTEPYLSSIGIYLNSDGMREYCYAEYEAFLKSNSVHEVWFEYDGLDKILYVYVAEYVDGKVSKPSVPTLMLNIDLEELWGGDKEFGICLRCQGGWDPATFIYRGIEVDSYPDIHGSHEEAIEILSPESNGIYELGDTISVFGRINDSSEDINVVVSDEDGNVILDENSVSNNHFAEIVSLDTSRMDEGNYKIVIKTGENSKTVDFTLVDKYAKYVEITDCEITEEGMYVYGNIDVSLDSSYVLYKHRTGDDYWDVVGTGEGNQENSLIGFISINDLPEEKVVLRLVVTLENGKTESAYRTFTYDLSTLIPTPTPTPTPEITNEPTPTPEVPNLTDEELFVDIEDSQEGMEISFISDIKGTVSGTSLKSYDFEIIPVASEVPSNEVEYTSEVLEDVLGQVDATLLTNGYYIVRVTAYTESGENLSDEITVLVTGTAKIGIFEISFLDLTTGLNNFPIDVYRTYDSRKSNEVGDFGYGWNLSIGGPRISISTNLGSNWSQDHYSGLAGMPVYYWIETRTHEVTIDWGNGKTETFSLKLTPSEQAITLDTGIGAYFEGKGNTTSRLEILDEHTNLTYNGGDLFSFDLSNQFNPQNFLLTTRDGTKYYFNSSKGLIKVEDTYGRIIEITEDGIYYSDGSGLTINRDEDGLVASITDGTQTVAYSYDENKDLVKVTERTGNNVSFSYVEHYLNDIVDSRGVHATRNEYDENGRLVAIIDADGNRIEYDHNLGDRTEVITNRLGYSTVYVYDDFGNVISETDALGRTTTRTYDENNNLSSETNPMGSTTYYSYSANGDILYVEDEQGRSVINTYSTEGNLLTMSQCGVLELELFYDVHGNITSSEDAIGNTQYYVYSTMGNLNSVSDSIGSIINCTYDNKGNVTSITNANGSVTNYGYDSLDRIVSRSTTYNGKTLTDSYTYDIYDNITEIIYSDGTRESFTYDSLGNCTQGVDLLGNTIDYTYDIYGNLIRIDYPDGTSESFTYDLENQQVSSTDRDSLTTKYTYDPVGNMTTITYPSGLVTTYTYDDCNRVQTVDNNITGITSYEYDYLGRNTKITDSLGNSTEYSYDTYGLVDKLTDANGNSYVFSYDAAGNQTQVVYPNGSTYKSSYDLRSRLVSETDAEENTTSYEYDSMDRLISVTKPDGGKWIYEYDSIGNIIKVTDSLGNSTTYTYDEYGRVAETINAEGKSATCVYNEYGQTVESTDFGGNTTNYTYDSYGRVSTETTEEGVIKYFYNNVGQLIKVSSIEGDICYSYTEEGYILSKMDENNQTIFYAYNELGLMTSITIDDKKITYTYDSLGRLETVTDQDGNITTYSYDNVGNLIKLEYSNGVVTTYQYNEVNLLISEVTTDSEGNVIESFKYTLGINGERLKVEELTRTVEYTYDSCERLTSEKITCTNGKVTETSYTYDLNSNRLTKTVNGEVTKYTYNELNQLIAEDDIIYTYDDAGNLIAGSRNNILLFSYEYSSCNQMTRSLVYTVEGILTAEYEYNYLGDRISKVVDGTRTTYTLDYSKGLSQILEETTDGKTIFYVRGLELISREELTGTYFYIFDGGNTVRALVDEDGNVTDKYVFDSFGNKVSHEGDSSNSYGFQGEQLDEETELYYLRARYMNPSTGTFTSMDTYGGSLSDPTSLHKYLFANSNPVKYCDPTGNMTLAQEELAIGVLLMVNTITLVGLKSIGFINSKENKNCIFSVSLQKGFLGMTFVSILQSILLLEILYASQSRKLRKNMINAYKNGDRGGKKPPDYKNAAHHIVPILMARAQKARDVLIKFGIDLNDAVNGVFLPTVKNVSNACYHCALHTEEYIKYIESLLEKCTTVEEVYEVLMIITEKLLNGTCPH